MAITRDPDFPEEIAQLMSAFNRLAQGYSTIAVLEASANMLIASIGAHTRAGGGGREDAIATATQIGQNLPRYVSGQWDRQARPTDIEVRHG
ncbi:MAG: hypothetical protein EPN45_19505 [Rhizobiaceae bacterium]|nr:MAG: hypothetical protein EPN45_19505 [Rhizobiaceae bacterium]